MMSQGYVYVIHAIGTNRVKIGHTNKTAVRLRGLQTASPFPLEIALAIPGSVQAEKYTHRKLAQFRKVGEWFELPDGVLETVKVLVQEYDRARQIIGTGKRPKRVIRYRLEARKMGSGNYSFRLRWSDGKGNRPVRPIITVAASVYRLIRAGDYEAFKRCVIHTATQVTQAEPDGLAKLPHVAPITAQ